MSAIGGIFDISGKEIDYSILDRMRMAMSIRAGRQGTAYLGGSVGMLFGNARSCRIREADTSQPAIFERKGEIYSLTFDSDTLSGESLFEGYRVYGVDFLGRLYADFALALYDGERKMLLLARDKRGSKPLFYRIYKGKLYYASEVKGLYAATGDSISVCRELLSLHISAPMGVYRAANLMTDVNEVLPGECVLFTSLGMSRFRYRDSESRRPRARSFSERPIVIPSAYQSKQSIREILSSALLCFDYPQFDADMPALTELLERAANEERDSLFFEDITRSKSIPYSLEREDRLGALYGVSAIGVRSKDIACASGSKNKIYRSLLSLILSLDSSQRAILLDVLGRQKLDFLMRRFESCAESIGSGEKKDTDAEIRILGMLYQTVLWAESRELCIKQSSLCQSALSMI